MWAVREIAKETIAVGFFDKQDIEIYVGDQLKKTIDVGMKIFGFIIPPIRPVDESSEALVTLTAGWPRHLIALDNVSYKAIDLQNENPQDSNQKMIATIHTGIGGYMPRYLTRVIDEGQRFSMTTICQNS